MMLAGFNRYNLSEILIFINNMWGRYLEKINTWRNTSCELIWVDCSDRTLEIEAIVLEKLRVLL